MPPTSRQWPDRGRGEDLYELVADLYPICRSITGDGVRETLQRIGAHVPSRSTRSRPARRRSTGRFRDEWNIRDAYVARIGGERVDRLPRDQPARGRATACRSTRDAARRAEGASVHDARTSRTGSRTARPTTGRAGASASPRARSLELERRTSIDVCIDARSRTVTSPTGSCLLPGERDDEVLISTHVCHPSLANDNLSGSRSRHPGAERWRSCRRRLSYRFLFIPGTIGAITWLSRNRDAVDRRSSTASC